MSSQSFKDTILLERYSQTKTSLSKRRTKCLEKRWLSITPTSTRTTKLNASLVFQTSRIKRVSGTNMSRKRTWPKSNSLTLHLASTTIATKSNAWNLPGNTWKASTWSKPPSIETTQEYSLGNCRRLSSGNKSISISSERFTLRSSFLGRRTPTSWICFQTRSK